MYQKIDRALQEILANNQLIIAFSAGVDSVALTLICRQLTKNLILCYFDHQIRPQSEIRQDIEVLKSTAQLFQLEYFIGHKDVPSFCQENNLSLEDGARQSRYEFLEKIALENNCQYVVTGHHKDDQSETILLKFIRGSGLKGLSGISAVSNFRNIKLIRPLLNYSKQELKQLVKKKKLSFHEDLTNQDQTIKRNLLRKKIIPQIRKINSNFEETIVNAANIYQAEDNFLQKQSQQIYQKVLLRQKENQLLIDTKGLKLYDISIQRRVVRLAIEQLQGNLQDISLAYIENFLDNNCNQLYLNQFQQLEVRKIQN